MGSRQGPKKPHNQAQPEARRQRREARLEERRRGEEARKSRMQRRRFMLFGGGAAVIVCLAAVFFMVNRANAAPEIDGIKCEPMEGIANHTHAHLAIFDRGAPVVVPANIGILYGSSGVQCYYWLHTHAANGVLHVESPNGDTYTLGQFFDMWGQTLSRSQVATVRAHSKDGIRAYVDGKLYTGDLRAIPLKRHELITLESGPPWVPPPSYTFAPTDF